MADEAGPSGVTYSDEIHDIEPRMKFLEPRFEAHTGPGLQIWGYVGSLVLTFLAFGLVLNRVMPPAILLAIVLTLALGQAALQLGVFMHVREGRGFAWQLLPLGLAFFIAFAMIATSIWIMLFKTGVS
jgi:cytochrome aa3 quinol oxidase subunit IV